jgi:hypothetical protein
MCFNPADPEVMQIAGAFLEAFERGWRNHDLIMQWMESEAGRRAFAQVAPELARFYQGKTKEELESYRPYAAIAVGVAAAVKFALQSQVPPP